MLLQANWISLIPFGFIYKVDNPDLPIKLCTENEWMHRGQKGVGYWKYVIQRQKSFYFLKIKNKLERSWTHAYESSNNVFCFWQLHCKCLHGITGTLQENRSAGNSTLWGFLIEISLQNLQGFSVNFELITCKMYIFFHCNIYKLI